VREGQDGFLSGASLAIDSQRGILYASTAAAPYMRGYSKADFGKTGVFAFDLKTGKTLRQVWLKAKGQFHFLNALAIDHAGTVYVSDSGEAGIYRWNADGETLERFLGAETFGATQGLAFSEDEKTLYVADYSNGVWAVDMATKQARQVPGPEAVWLGNLDGLTRVRDGFIAVQIQIKPERVLRLKLDQQLQKISSVEILEFNRPDYQSPIQGAIGDSAFLYIANSQLDLGNGRTGEFASERAKPTIVLKLPL
jgi:sugar lactone lactonase YvrE